MVGIAWRPLAGSDPIGVVALSGPVDGERLTAGLRALAEWGNPLVLAPNLHARRSYLAGDDDERLEGLDRVVEHGARVIIGARGGYGVTRLLDRIRWRELVDRGVSLVGFSDLTAILNPLAAAGGSLQVHGPMVAAGMAHRHSRERLRRLLAGELCGRDLFRFAERAVVRGGHARGVAMGGNLSVLCALIGTRHAPSFDGAVVFLEEVGEPLYRIDRMLTHLRASATFRGVKALIGGSLRGCRPAAECAARWRDLLVEAAPEDVPVVVGLPFGHGAGNRAFPVGATVEVDTSAGRVIWSV